MQSDCETVRGSKSANTTINAASTTNLSTASTPVLGTIGDNDGGNKITKVGRMYLGSQRVWSVWRELTGFGRGDC